MIDALVYIIQTAIYVLTAIKVIGIPLLAWDILLLVCHVLVKTLIKPVPGDKEGS